MVLLGCVLYITTAFTENNIINEKALLHVHVKFEKKRI